MSLLQYLEIINYDQAVEILQYDDIDEPWNCYRCHGELLILLSFEEGFNKDLYDMDETCFISCKDCLTLDYEVGIDYSQWL